jgi:hypothetical protein
MPSAFEQVIRLNLAKFSPEAAKQKHIEIARDALAAFMARQSVKPGVQIFTDGQPAANENSVKPFGIITYRFLRLREICAFAITQAQALSPVDTGRYRKSWFFLVNQQEVALEAIPEDATQVILTNDQPYSRKINVGAKGFERYAPPGICEKVRVLVNAKYGALVDTKVDFITLVGGYQLMHPIKRGVVTQTELTYPATVMNAKRFAA